MKNLQEFKEHLDHNLKQILSDDFIVNICISKLGGENRASLLVEIYGKNPAYDIKHNSKCHMHLWAHDCLKELKTFEAAYISKKLKFRKIKADNFQTLADKLCQWVARKKPEMRLLEANQL